MNIVRTFHNRENPFVQLSKRTVWDEKFTPDTFYVWARMMSRPNDWKFDVKEMAKACKIGEKRMYNILKELIEVGYVIRFDYYTSGGKGSACGRDTQYVFFEYIPTPEELQEIGERFKKSFRNGSFRRVENRPHILNTPTELKTPKGENKKNKEEDPVLSVPSEEEAKESVYPEIDWKPVDPDVHIPKELEELTCLGVPEIAQKRMVATFSEFAIQRSCQDLEKYVLKGYEVPNATGFLIRSCQCYDLIVRLKLPIDTIWVIRKDPKAFFVSHKALIDKG